MKSDTWRIAYSYIFGGIYADTDIKPLQPYNKWEFYPFTDY